MTRFDGDTFDQRRDGSRLAKQLERVRELMADGSWRFLWQIAEGVGAPPQSVSARLRDLRKPRFGSWRVERKHYARGIWAYRLLPPLPPGQLDLPFREAS